MTKQQVFSHSPQATTQASWLKNKNIQALLAFLASLAALLILWEVGEALGLFASLIPSASETLVDFWEWISDPFYDFGPNDKGIGWHLLVSLRRVAIGFILGSLIAIPVGIAVGLSQVASKAIDPYVQLFKPVSPLAWLPLGLGLLQDSELTAIFVIAISSIWPTLINTKFGISNVSEDYLDVTKTLGASRRRTLLKVILPAAAPSIVSGLRISMGISWLVIVAAEMLVGGTGLGYFVWNEWNNLSITSIITAIIVIGMVGIILDQLFGILQTFVSFGKQSS
ncbi:nitrate ABC transporter permease [Euhalothece natronophila Z-M001]|uniref:Nitrate ABC transporter permease n=1 Tax=Euhalothece natronophila Z-M001 TaxID=522448 RepID=A0A5B8NN07_9CHRO|nr:nitrate ABC transporter permease [Euhalothece natronophila]QDZ39519.1 nitrate ABC transporter permease [Euhalothece natronophila Z-M001]